MLAVAFVVGAVLIGVTASRVFVDHSGPGSVIPDPSVIDIGTDDDQGDRKGRKASAEEDGHVRDGVTVFNEGVPGVVNLDPALLGALRSAATDAAGDGIEFYVNSGWRSAEYQEQLLRDAVTKYGSVEEASRWVAKPGKSAHVSGDAVDLGPTAATQWLADNGPAYGLCQIYQNEPWHFELRPEAVDHGCPVQYADPTQDPRLQ